MSGIVGLVNVDGKPIDRPLLARLSETMEFRGPDAQEIWSRGAVGFGHAMLHTTPESRRCRQPCSLDDRVWIVADARVDAQADLRRKLRAAGAECPPNASDAELILHAYRIWGEECVRHLVGDFAFAIWDARRETLFCARDHFGVKPFFYAHAGNGLVFANTLNCVRQHPQVGDDLNDLAIADFLLFGVKQDAAATAFAGIWRLPPAHCMSWSQGTLRVVRYWDFAVTQERRYADAGDYVAEFMEHLQAAVADRLRSDRIGVLMSGGLDSASIAVVAQSLLSMQHDEFDLRAYTCVFDRLFADEERQFAALTAQALGIPIQYLVADDYTLFERWETPALKLPEPADEPLAAVYIDQAAQMAARSRVALTGWDGDALLSIKENGAGGAVNRCVRFARAAWHDLSRGRWPRLDLRARVNRLFFGVPEAPFAPPEWLNPSLIEELDLPARWREVHARSDVCASGHQETYRILNSPLLTNLLENYDPGVTRIPVETRHPFLDIRVVEYVLSLPVSPWCIDKRLLRTAMRDRLPESIRHRPKTPLLGDPVIELLQRADRRWLDTFGESPALDRYVDSRVLRSVPDTRDPDKAWIDMRPLCLNRWLQQQTTRSRTTKYEDHYEVA